MYGYLYLQPAASSASATGLSKDREDSKEKISTSPLPEAL